MHMYMDVYMCVCVCICVYMYIICMYMYVYIYIYICLYIACMCNLFHLALGNEDGGVQLVCESACCFKVGVGVFFDRRKDRGVVCVFSIFNEAGSVCRCVCVYTHTQTHTAQMGYLDVSPGVRMRHMEGPKNPDGQNLGIHIFVCVYKVHMCIYILKGGMRSWTNCFFLLRCLFFLRKVEDMTVTTISKPQSLTSVRTHFGENKRVQLESSKQNYYIISF